MNKIRKLKIEMLLEALRKVNEVGDILTDTQSEDALNFVSELEVVINNELGEYMSALNYPKCDDCRKYVAMCQCSYFDGEG